MQRESFPAKLACLLFAFERVVLSPCGESAMTAPEPSVQQYGDMLHSCINASHASQTFYGSVTAFSSRCLPVNLSISGHFTEAGYENFEPRSLQFRALLIACRCLRFLQSGGHEQGNEVHTAELQSGGHLPLRVDQEEVEGGLPHHQLGHGRGRKITAVGCGHVPSCRLQ